MFEITISKAKIEKINVRTLHDTTSKTSIPKLNCLYGKLAGK